MTWAAVAVGGATLVGGILSSNAQRSAGNAAAGAQTSAANAGIQAQQEQFAALQKLLAPYSAAGTSALSQQQDLSGANGPDAQQAAITALQKTPAFTSQLQLGNNQILANASATGGLRGGNTQGALAYFGPQLLSQTINDQYNRLGGLVSIGENAAAGTGNAGMQLGQNTSNLLQQSGAAQAGAYLNAGVSQQNTYNALLNSLGTYMQMKGLKF